MAFKQRRGSCFSTPAVRWYTSEASGFIGLRRSGSKHFYLSSPSDAHPAVRVENYWIRAVVGENISELRSSVEMLGQTMSQ